MKRTLLILLAFLALAGGLDAQNSKKVKDLKKQRDKLQRELKLSQQELNRTKKDLTTHKKTEKAIGVELDNKLNGIREAETKMDSLDNRMNRLQNEVNDVSTQLVDKKEKFCRALRMARAYRHIQSPTLFILSGKSLMQMSRRARNTNAFAGIMRGMGEDLTERQSKLLHKQNDILSAKSQMNNLMRSVMVQRHELGIQQVDERNQIATLNTKQKGLQSQLSKQQKQLVALNKKIDQVVAAEIEAARKRAEAARKKALEAERRKAEAAGKKSGKGTSSSSSKSTTSTAKLDTWLTPEERALNGSFEQNRGRLPVPITGAYKFGERFGTYTVSGMQHVQLDNKGTNFIGKPGAHARAIFDGEVTAVFSFYGTKGVLIRHGSYISVYCNLSSVAVSRGQKVHTRDNIGAIATNEDGQCVLHFQLRKETAKLNPESWIGR